MNVLTDTAFGVRSLTDAEVRMRQAQVRAQLAHASLQDQLVMVDELIEHRFRLAPDRHFEDVYKPPGYVPGWERDP